MNTNAVGWQCVVVLVVVCLTARAQDTVLTDSLNEVVVSALREEPLRQTSIHVEPLSLESTEHTSGMNVTDAVSQLPGVTLLSTGPAISKPVIRGLYGNRILVLINGMRFDNQQWQDEHGLGLSDIGLSRIEVIKGPLSILHGSEAVGGVVNLVPECKPPAGERIIDAGFRLSANTLGPLVQTGVNANRGTWWWGVRVGAESHADYGAAPSVSLWRAKDRRDNRVLNSRYEGAYALAHLGFVRKCWLSENRYTFSSNRFGFIFSDLGQFLEPDGRWSREMIGPHHIVQLHLFSSENTFQLPQGTLKMNIGGQSNMRQEDEGGGKLSLQMHLLSGLATARWSKSVSDRTTLILAINSSLEQNVNYGGRKIVPDATMGESSFSLYLHHQWSRFVVEYGAGAGWRRIETLLTPSVNTEEKEIPPFLQDRYFANGMAGVSWNPTPAWNLKLNSATGVRAPNLAELSSNGLHEGVYTYELGNPGLENEQNLNTDITVSRHGKQVRVLISAFYNAFRNYIYLQPTDALWYGFPVYEFVQNDAAISGGEVAFCFKPAFAQGLELGSSYSGLVGQLNSGEYLPFMPAQQVTPRVSYRWNQSKRHFGGSVFTEVQVTTAQTFTAPLEKSTPAYELLNAGINLQWQVHSVVYYLSITGKNLLDEAYYDHLSRLKTYNILNMGRNVVVQLKISFSQKFKNKASN